MGQGIVSSDQMPDRSALIEVTAVFHHLAPHARVIGVDHIRGLVDQSLENLRKDGIKIGADVGGVEIVHGDGRLGE